MALSSVDSVATGSASPHATFWTRTVVGARSTRFSPRNAITDSICPWSLSPSNSTWTRVMLAAASASKTTPF
jgi:hypothetical protein